MKKIIILPPVEINVTLGNLIYIINIYLSINDTLLFRKNYDFENVKFKKKKKNNMSLISIKIILSK